MLADELKEIPDKIIPMADAYINVRSMMLNNGYFDCWTKKWKIEKLYEYFKEQKFKWNSPKVRKIAADCKGKFPNYEDFFLDPQEFDKLKKLTESKIKKTIKNFDTNEIIITSNNRSLLFGYQNLQLELLWCKAYENVTEPEIKINLVKLVAEDNLSQRYKPIILKSFLYIYHMNSLWERVWKSKVKKILIF